PEDIPPLIDYFLPRFSRELGRNIHSVAPEARQRLLGHDWPGNVRQLQSVLKYAIVQAPGDVLTLDCRPEDVKAPAAAARAPADCLAGLAEFTEGLLRAGEL